MSESNIYIIIYICLWIITFLYFLKKKRVFGAGNFILSTYLLYSVLSFLLYNHENSNFLELRLFPFVYLFLMLFIALYPVLKYDETNDIIPPNRVLVNRIACLYIILSFLITPVVLTNIVEGFFLVLFDPTGGDELYSEYRMQSSSNGERSLFVYFKFGYNVLSDIGVLIFFYYLTLRKKNYFVIFGLLFAILMSLLESISNGLRTSMTMKIFQLITCYFLFQNKLTGITRKITKDIGIVFVSLVAILIIVINSSRFSDYKYDSNYQLLYYAGQANLYFNQYGLDAGGTRNGDRTCNSFKKWLFFDNVPKDGDEVRAKYSHLKLDDKVFSTYIGDISLDFGPITTAFIICSFSLLFTIVTRTRRNKIRFHQLMIIFFVMTVCAQGGMYLFNFSFKQNIKIVFFIIFYVLFKLDYEAQRKKQKELMRNGC